MDTIITSRLEDLELYVVPSAQSTSRPFCTVPHYDVENKELAFIYLNQKTVVYLGLDSKYNEEYCNANNIRRFDFRYIGGTIVSSPGDVGVVIVTRRQHHICEKIMKKLKAELGHGGEDAHIDRNDLMVNGTKTASYAKTCFYRSGQPVTDGVPLAGSVMLAVMQFSINCNVALVRRICEKPMAKMPGALSRYGITQEHIIQMVRKELMTYG